MHGVYFEMEHSREATAWDQEKNSAEKVVYGKFTDRITAEIDYQVSW